MNTNMNYPFFKDFSRSAVKSISNAAIYRSYTPKTDIIVEGKPCEAVYLVLVGGVNVFRIGTNGRKLVLQHLVPGDWFNVPACIQSSEVNLYSVRTIIPTKVMALTLNDFRRLLVEHPVLALKVLENQTKCMMLWIDQMENLGLHSTSGRVAAFILEHADDNNMIYWQCTQSDIADRLGTVADVVGRVLRKFADDGLIQMPVEHCIVIIDREGLEKETLN